MTIKHDNIGCLWKRNVAEMPALVIHTLTICSTVQVGRFFRSRTGKKIGPGEPYSIFISCFWVRFPKQRLSFDMCLNLTIRRCNFSVLHHLLHFTHRSACRARFTSDYLDCKNMERWKYLLIWATQSWYISFSLAKGAVTSRFCPK